jgi:hypothetical protein
MGPLFNALFAWHRRRRLLRILAALTLVFLLATSWFANEMQDHGVGIFELEFTRTSENAEKYHADLGPEGREDAEASLGLDFGYLIAYGLFLAGASIAISERNWRARRRRLAALGPWVAWGALAAALFDAVENALLISIVNGETGDPWPAIAFGSTVAKFALAGIAVVYVVGGWLTTLRHRRAPPAMQPY